MKINRNNFKDIAENILNGTIRGTFTLRNESKLPSSALGRNDNECTKRIFPYRLDDGSKNGIIYSERGRFYHAEVDHNLDIVAFENYDNNPMNNFKNIADKCFNGELSGTFIIRVSGNSVLRREVHSSELERSIYPTLLRYKLGNIGFFSDTGWSTTGYYVADFIKDDMKEVKEVRIEVPEGYEIDKENSTFEKIVFKMIKSRYPESWEEYCLNQKECYHTMSNYSIQSLRSAGLLNEADKDSYPTRELADASIALCQLLHLKSAWIHQWSVDNGLKKDWKYDPTSDLKYYSITDTITGVDVVAFIRYPRVLSFPTLELAEKFYNTFSKLIEQAKELI